MGKLNTTTLEITHTELVMCFEALHADLVHFVQQCPNTHWQALTVEEGWRVGVTVHHIGAIHYPVIDQVQAMIDDRPLTVRTMADVDLLNAKHVREHADCTKAETLEFLKHAGQHLRSWLMTINDTDLARTADIPFMGDMTTAAKLLRVVLIELSNGHLRSAQAASI